MEPTTSKPTNTVGSTVTFCLPSMPLSINSIYQIIFQERRVELKPQARQWKTHAKEQMPPWKPQSDKSLICIDMMFYYNFYCKNGELREFDSPNCTKLLIDAVAERYGFKDKRVKRFPGDSVHSLNEKVVVTVSEYFLESEV